MGGLPSVLYSSIFFLKMCATTGTEAPCTDNTTTTSWLKQNILIYEHWKSIIELCFSLQSQVNGYKICNIHVARIPTKIVSTKEQDRDITTQKKEKAD